MAYGGSRCEYVAAGELAFARVRCYGDWTLDENERVKPKGLGAISSRVALVAEADGGWQTMIDRTRRDKLALHLRQYVSGRTWNQTLENRLGDDVSFGWLPEHYGRVPDRDPDPLIPPMLEHVWSLYSDASFHRARGKHAIVGDDRRTIARYILFLHSEREYSWPSFRFVKQSPEMVLPFLRWLKTILPWASAPIERPTFETDTWEEFERKGDYTCWPFLNQEELELESRNIRYMDGGRAT